MIRIEIIANNSVQEEILNNLEAIIPDFYYTIIPLAYGKGRQSRKLGTTTWPETNFMMISYCDEKYEKTICTVMEYIKSKFTAEGINLFILHERI